MIKIKEVKNYVQVLNSRTRGKAKFTEAQVLKVFALIEDISNLPKDETLYKGYPIGTYEMPPSFTRLIGPNFVKFVDHALAADIKGASIIDVISEGIKPATRAELQEFNLAFTASFQTAEALQAPERQNIIVSNDNVESFVVEGAKHVNINVERTVPVYVTQPVLRDIAATETTSEYIRMLLNA